MHLLVYVRIITCTMHRLDNVKTDYMSNTTVKD